MDHTKVKEFSYWYIEGRGKAYVRQGYYQSTLPNRRNRLEYMVALESCLFIIQYSLRGKSNRR